VSTSCESEVNDANMIIDPVETIVVTENKPRASTSTTTPTTFGVNNIMTTDEIGTPQVMQINPKSQRNMSEKW
jgi:hypothetical protein